MGNYSQEVTTDFTDDTAKEFPIRVICAIRGLGFAWRHVMQQWTRARWFVLGAVAILLAVPASSPAQNFFIKDGDTVVIMGDSITEQHLYSNYLEMWTVSRFPAWKLTFRNVGIGGDRSTGGNSRFARDVLAYKPTALTVDFGMNDGGYPGPFNEKSYDVYVKGLQGIADQAKKAGIRVAWITPQPVERGEPGPQLVGYNLTLEKFSDGPKEIAKKNGGLFVDQFHPYLQTIESARKKDDKLRITGGDPVHPGPPGQVLMAAAILNGMKFPVFVSEAAIMLDDKGLLKGSLLDNCEVTDIQIKDGIRFKRLDKALPFFPADARGILKWAPTLLDDMNYYGLKIEGLKPGKYEIKFAGKKVAERSDEELGKGVNLADAALTAGPVADKVNQVWKAVQDKNRYFHDQIFRGVVLAGPKSPVFKDRDPSDFDNIRKEAYAERMQKMPALDAAVRDALKIEPYLVEVLPLEKK